MWLDVGTGIDRGGVETGDGVDETRSLRVVGLMRGVRLFDIQCSAFDIMNMQCIPGVYHIWDLVLVVY